MLQKRNGIFHYSENGNNYERTVDVDQSAKITAWISTIPAEIDNQKIIYTFQKFGQISKVIPIRFSLYIYPIYSGRQLIVFNKFIREVSRIIFDL